MTDECIHGFPIELCDICSPRQRPEPEAPVRTAAPRRSRAAATSLRSTPGGSPRSGGRSSSGASAESGLPKARVFSALRAHHFTHIDNLAGIVDAGALLARSEAAPEFDVASTGAVTARADVATPDGATALDHVPFSLTPDGASWDAVRSGAEDGRWSEAARRSRPGQYAVLVVPTTAFGASVVLADGDVSLRDTRFAVGPDAATTMLRRTDVLDPEMRRVELLAGPRVELSAVAVIGVANDQARRTVRELLAGAANAPRVAVFPPWFVPTVAE